MAEYIDRKALIEHLEKDPLFDLVEQYGITGVIESFPATDVQPVKHGRWIQDEHTYSGCWTYNYVCSACGEIGGSWLRNIRRDQMFPYCPFCGAKMDGET